MGDKLVLAYVGTHGLARALEARVRRQEDIDVTLLVAGARARADAIAEQVKIKELFNVIVVGRRQISLMPSIWSLCGVSVVHLDNAPLFRKVKPSKIIFESSAVGLSVLIAVLEGGT